MRIFPGAAAFAAARAPDDPPLAVAVGTFDGVHLGHRALLDEARMRADRRGGASAVLTFTPHPARLFAPAKAPPLIMSLERRLELMAEAGVEVAIVEAFTPAFAAIEADTFVRRVLAQDLAAADVVVGYDFSFGRGRAGNVERLQALGAELGIGVAVIPQVAVEGLPCSSTRIRELCAAGDMRRAAALLGRPVELEGRIVRGAGRGKGLGFPTANLAPEGELVPKIGIYAARGTVLDGPEAGATRRAALSIGRNPTFAAGPREVSSLPSSTRSGWQGPPPLARSADPPLGAVTVEAYLLDFNGDLYDRRLRLEVVERLRDEQRFASVDALIAQITADVERVRALES